MAPTIQYSVVYYPDHNTTKDTMYSLLTVRTLHADVPFHTWSNPLVLPDWFHPRPNSPPSIELVHEGPSDHHWVA